ncbi:hypothetical protein [Streptomyces luteireticuli]|uniref:hypothetical protein n=1 Tax=Streptomyces luteireticuli TaxID=173858 RepID=UPI0035592DF2
MTTEPAQSTEYEARARQLLAEAYDDAPARHVPTPGPVAPGIAPLVVPEGYTVRETHRTHADGTTEVVREIAPPAPAGQADASPDTDDQGRPDWLAAHRARIRLSAYLTGAGAVTVLGGVYGSDIVGTITAGAAALWAATVTVLKVVAGTVVVGVALRIAFGGRKRRGTFEGTVRGTWR